MKVSKTITAIVLVLVALFTGPAAWGQDGEWQVEADPSDRNFSVIHKNSSTEGTVHYRTVSQSAIAGVHFQNMHGELNFKKGEYSKIISIELIYNTADPRYYFHLNGASHYLRIEVLDPEELNVLASDDMVLDNLMDSDYQDYFHSFDSTYINRNLSDFVYLNNGSFASSINSGKYYDATLTDNQGKFTAVVDNFNYNYKWTVFIGNCVTKMSPHPDFPDYLKRGGNKLYATACFTQKEENDGYQYIQILADNETTFDGEDPNGNVNTPSKSLYKACFEGYKGSTLIADKEYKWFFPHRYDANNRAGASQTAAHSEFPDANSYLWQQAFQSHDPSYRATDAGAFVLDLDTQNLTFRFDARGSGDDTWMFKDLFVRLAVLDNTAPTLLDNLLVAKGLRYRSSLTSVSLPFSEVVVVTGTPTLTTSWGTFTYEAGSGSNVLTFTGRITAKSGTVFSATALTGTVRDVAGNAFTWPGDQTLSSCTVGSRELDDFQRDSKGRYLIQSKSDLYTLATAVNAGQNMEGKTFLQTANITCDSKYVPIGKSSHPFSGTYDGNGHSISGIQSDRDEDNQGLFGLVTGGIIQNVILRSSTFKGRHRVGGIVGYGYFATVTGCSVESSVSILAKSNVATYHGGIAGYFYVGAIEGCYSAAAVTDDGHTDCNGFGGIIGRCEHETTAEGGITMNNTTVKNCLYAGTDISCSGEKGAIIGTGIVSAQNNYYINPNLPGGKSGEDINASTQLGHTITLGNRVALPDPQASYATSKLAGYSNILGGYLRYGGSSYTWYSGEGQSVALRYTGTVPYGSEVIYSVNGTPISGNSFTMPGEAVSVTAQVQTAETMTCYSSSALFNGQQRCWFTFYHPSCHYKLPADACACIMKDDYALYRLGDGSVIPAGCPVVVVVSRTSEGNVKLTKTDESVSVSTAGNILRGTKAQTSVSSLNLSSGKNVYVLNKDAQDNLGFFPFTGTLSAGKVYYIK